MPITDSEKTRRRALLKTHYDVENDHDMNGIIATFAPDGEMLYNRIPFTDPQSIRDVGVLNGRATQPHPKPVKNYLKTSKFTSYRNYFLLLHFESWSSQIAQVQKASLMNHHQKTDLSWEDHERSPRTPS